MDELNLIAEIKMTMKCATYNAYSMRCIELFCGCGGMALGFERAGFEHLLVTDIDKNCCATISANKPNWNVVRADISTLKYDYDDIDVLCGGFPCQSYSWAGKKEGLSDPRGQLFWEF